MNKTLSAMVAGATLLLASQASAVTINFTAGTNIATGISGITYSTTANFGAGGFANGDTNAYAQGNANGLGVNATANPGPANTAPDSGYRNVIDSRVGGVSVVGAWEMLTVTFSEAVNLTDFILGLLDENDDFEYSFDGGAFTSVRGSQSDVVFDPFFVLTQADQGFTTGPWNPVTTFSIRAVGEFENDDDDFSLKSASISAVPLPAGAPLLLAGLAGLAALRRRKKAA